VTAGQAVWFNATVAPQSGTAIPTGTVTFLDGQTALGTGTLNGSGGATFSTTALAAGTQSVTVSYGGSSTDAPSTSAPITVTVGSSAASGYTMAVSKSDLTVGKGQIANLAVILTPVNGFKLPVTLTCSGLPAGTSCSFSPPTVTFAGAPVSSTLSIQVDSPPAAAQNRSPSGSSGRMLAFALAMPWGIFSLLGLSKRRNRSRVAAWSIRLAVAAALIAGSLWMSGCGYSTNGSVFTMTLTAAADNVTPQTSQVTVSIMP
jgi:phage baseplate assembly protein gpV